MAITNIKVSNFKSFKDLDLNLGRFNVVIGANASGKSNFVEIFRFLKDTEDNNLDDAISLHGGCDSIVNRKAGNSAPFGVRITSDRKIACGSGSRPVRARETVYGFSLRVGKKGNGVIIDKDQVIQTLRLSDGENQVENRSREKVAGEELRLRIEISEDSAKVSVEPAEETCHLREDQRFSALWPYLGTSASKIQQREARGLLVRMRFLGFLAPWESLFGRIGVYDIDPHLAKSPFRMAGKAVLQENGENLALILKQIRADPEKSRKFHNLLRYMLPFAVQIGTRAYLGTSILLKLREAYYDDALLAHLLSDGTIDVIALITALFFEDKDVVIIEEPERNIHPHLISGLMGLMKDASRNKQVLITTHSPEVVRHAGVENLLLLSRDEEGFSTVSRPADKDTVKIFLENNLGLEEVFVQELWGP
jgi:predicted ATPase